MLSDEHSNFFYSALLVIGAFFAVYNIRQGIKNWKKANNDDYYALLKENKSLRERLNKLEELL